MRCDYCGHENADDSASCIDCGTMLGAAKDAKADSPVLKPVRCDQCGAESEFEQAYLKAGKVPERQSAHCRRPLQHRIDLGDIPVTHLLDTHAWIQRALGEPLPSLVDRTLIQHAKTLALADISLWEAAKLVELGRLELSLALGEFFRLAITPELTVLPVTPVSRLD